jgi:hypothetical protein
METKTTTCNEICIRALFQRSFNFESISAYNMREFASERRSVLNYS